MKFKALRNLEIFIDKKLKEIVNICK